MAALSTVAAALRATANERRRQLPVRVLLALLMAWGLYKAGHSNWVGSWLALAALVQVCEILALRRFQETGRNARPAHVLLGLASTAAIAAVFAGGAAAIWAMDGRGLQGFAMLIIAGGLLTNVASGIESRFIFYVGATPYILALVIMPLMAIAGSPSGDPVLSSLGSLLFVGAIMTVYGRVYAARAAELEALKEAERRVEQAEGAMADRAAMAAIVSHELRTPVSAILAGAEAMCEDVAPAQRQDTAELILDAGRMMTRMLNDLLDHSKMEAGAMSLESRDFDLADLIADTVRFWRAQAAEKGLTLEATKMDQAVWLIGDPYRMRQILNNLLSNAIKFTAAGVIVIDVAANAQDQDGCALLITVRDQGVGIPPEAMARLFTPFAQGSSAVARTYGGTGLGLKVSRDLAQLMGGDLTVASQLGQGAAFTLSLDLRLGNPSGEGDDDERFVAEIFPSLRILAVDDHEINRRTLALVLQPLEVSLSTASDGMLALELLEQHPFDLVLMDVNMPGIDGNETTRRLRQSSGLNAGIPVIGFSAGTESHEIAECLAAGMTDWLPKPLEPQRLYEALYRATERN